MRLRWTLNALTQASLLTVLCAALPQAAAFESLEAAHAQLGPLVARQQPQVVEWRRHFHEFPELSGQEENTARYIAEQLEAMGLDVQRGVGGHGVVATLKGGKPGKMVALRADIDGLPIEEQTGLPFASKAKALYQGNEVSVMHACGHDAHTAILLGAAAVLTQQKDEIPGSIRFIFQPAEEGAPTTYDENGMFVPQGALAMVQEGVLDGVEAIFGLHISSNLPSGAIGYRAGPFMASADSFEIHVQGKGSHGSSPWRGVDPIVSGSQIVQGLQGIVSRQLDISQAPVVVSVGTFHAGTRHNVIPSEAVLTGTLRTYSEEARADAKSRIEKTATAIAESSGATATVKFDPANYPVTDNPRDLLLQTLPALQLAAPGKVMEIPRLTGSEDFSEFQKKVPGVFYVLGASKDGANFSQSPTNHSPSEKASCS